MGSWDGERPRFVVLELERALTFLLTIAVAGAAISGVVDWVERRALRCAARRHLKKGVQVGGLLAHEVRELIEGIAAAENIPAQDAYINKLTGEVMPEREGLEIDVDEGLYQVITAPRGKEIHLRRYVVQPTLTSAELQRITVVLGRYETGADWQLAANGEH